MRFFFFFQAEDGIRDYKVTGVQTCALPISPTSPARSEAASSAERRGTKEDGSRKDVTGRQDGVARATGMSETSGSSSAKLTKAWRGRARPAFVRSVECQAARGSRAGTCVHRRPRMHVARNRGRRRIGNV